MRHAELQNNAGRSAYRREVKAERPDIQATIATNLRALMQRRDWTQTALSKKSAVSQRHVSNVLNGKTGCGVEILDAIASAFGLPGWVLMIPGFNVDLIDSPALPLLMSHYRNAGPEGRELIDRLAERESHYSSSKSSKVVPLAKVSDR